MTEAAPEQVVVPAAQEAPGRIQLYIVKVSMSSENQVVASEEQGDYNKNITYLHPKDKRAKIASTRMTFRKPIDDACLNFHGLKICGESSKPFIIDKIKQASKSLNEIYEGLHADVLFIPLDFQEIFKGNLYAQIGDAINYQVYSGLFTRMETMLKRTEEGKELPERSRKALIRMVDNLKKINVTNNQEIDQKLAEFKDQIGKGEVKELADSLKAELDANKSRWAAIEL